MPSILPLYHLSPPLAQGDKYQAFLSGIWWGVAMRRLENQGQLAALAVLPSLASPALLPLAIMSYAWPLIGLGSAILLTLLVDRHLVTTGEAPAGWMELRVPLSLGLGLLTIAAGVLAGRV